MKELKIRQTDECSWEGCLGNELICEFEYFKDSNGHFWINNIKTMNKKCQGHGTKMIKAALAEYDEIYVSNVDKIDIKAKGLSGDLRYTNSDWGYEDSELKKFVDKLIKNDILKLEWVKNPFENI